MKTNLTLTAAGRIFFGRAFAALLLLVLGLGAAPKAFAGSGIFESYVILNPNNGGTRYYDAQVNTGNPDFMTFGNPRQPTDLGSYDRTSGQLILQGAQIKTFEDGTDVINQGQFYYRIYRTVAANGDAGTGGTFRQVNLAQSGAKSGNNRTFQEAAAVGNNFPGLPANNAVPINLVGLTSGAGTYFFEVYFSATGSNGGTAYSIFDSRDGVNYRATFTVTGVPATSTTWLGGDNPSCATGNSQELGPLTSQSNWFEPVNWTNGVPTPTTDVLVPNYAEGTSTRAANPCAVYPNIRATATTGPAQCRSLTLEGENASNRSILRLITGELRVSGDFFDVADSYIQRAGVAGNPTSFTLAGGNQTFDGSANFKNFTVDGGGVKRLTNAAAMTVDGTLRFVNGILQTQGVNASGSIVSLAPSAVIVGESETSYVLGYISTKEPALIGINQNFGNIGLDLTFTGGDPNGTQSNGTSGGVRIVRLTGVTVGSLLGGKPSIRRSYGIQPDNSSTASNVLVARIGVRYLDQELRGVQRGSVGPIDLDETQLTIWVSTSGGTGFENKSRDRINPSGNRVTQNGLTTFATTTLGENGAPLPVNFTYFTAMRESKGAMLNWGTAMEKDNAGFEVQMSLDGREFRTITTVRPATANSNAAHHYSYLDATASSGTRYYRLRQVDTDGTFAYTPVRVVNFGGSAEAAVASTSSVFPNPFRDGEQLVLSVKTAVSGTATVRVLDALGREVARQTADVSSETGTINLPSLDARPAGVYLVRLSLPSGATQTIKIQKQ